MKRSNFYCGGRVGIVRSLIYISVIVISSLFFTACYSVENMLEYVELSLDRFRPGRNEVPFILFDFDVVQPSGGALDLREALTSDFVYEGVRRRENLFILPGNETSMVRGIGNTTTSGLSTYQVARGYHQGARFVNHVSHGTEFGFPFRFEHRPHITSWFGWRTRIVRGVPQLVFHTGIDMQASRAYQALNVPLYALGVGHVIDVHSPGQGIFSRYPWNGAGNVVVTAHPVFGGMSTNPELTSRLLYYANIAERGQVLNAREAQELSNLLQMAGEANIRAQNNARREIVMLYYSSVMENYDNLRDPRAVLLLMSAYIKADGAVKSSNFINPIRSYLGTNLELDKVYNNIMTASLWANHADDRYLGYIRALRDSLDSMTDPIPVPGSVAFVNMATEHIFADENDFVTVNGNAGDSNRSLGFSFGRMGFYGEEAAIILRRIAGYLGGGETSGQTTYFFVYVHLHSVNVMVGDRVDTNTVVGREGATGNVFSTGHLHLTALRGDTFVYDYVWRESFGFQLDFLRDVLGVTSRSDFAERFGYSMPSKALNVSSIYPPGGNLQPYNEFYAMTEARWNN